MSLQTCSRPRLCSLAFFSLTRQLTPSFLLSPLRAPPRAQDNYGLYWRFWDILLRTNKHWEAFRKQLREAEAAQAAQAAKGPVAGGAAADEWVVKDGRLFVKNVAEERDMKLGTDNLAYTIIQNQIDDPAKKTGQQVQLQQEPAPYVTLPVSKTSPTSATPSASASSSGVTRSRAKSNKAQ